VYVCFAVKDHSVLKCHSKLCLTWLLFQITHYLFMMKSYMEYTKYTEYTQKKKEKEISINQ